MNAVTTSPIPRDIVQGFINEVLEKHYVRDDVYSVYAEQGNDYSRLFEEAWGSEADDRFSQENLSNLFYEQFMFDWYSDYELETLREIHDDLHESFENYAIDENLPMGDVETQFNQEIESLDDNIEFDYDDVLAHALADVNSWLTGINDKITSPELANVVASKMTISEADFLSEIKPISEFKAWFMAEYGIDGENYSTEIDSIVQVLDDDRHTEINEAHEDEDHEFEAEMAKTSLELVENASAEELIEQYDDFGLNEVLYHVGDLVLMEV